ncbi:hypothetical protein CDD83_138 [Cordyceps sp. RAO-2017]|nr:hypothetical protein CDD83_138 [Cordyceps sp. RAO-2017]
MAVWLQIGTRWRDGTRDAIAYSFRSSGRGTTAAVAPGAGTCSRTRIPMRHALGAATVPAALVRDLGIWDTMRRDGGWFDWILGGDEWVIEGWRVDARCADGSPKRLVFRGGTGLGLRIEHNAISPDEPTLVLHDPLAPAGWTVADAPLPAFCEAERAPRDEF